MTADALQRVHLEARRVYLATQVDALHAQALDLWRRANALRLQGEDSQRLAHMAVDTEEACYRLNRVLLAIDDELDEGEGNL